MYVCIYTTMTCTPRITATVLYVLAQQYGRYVNYNIVVPTRVRTYVFGRHTHIHKHTVGVRKIT